MNHSQTKLGIAQRVSDRDDWYYVQDDQNPERRLSRIWNRIKHFNEDIESSKSPENITAPMWLTNAGISTATTSITWAELHGILIQQQAALNYLTKELPREIVKAEQIDDKELNRQAESITKFSRTP